MAEFSEKPVLFPCEGETLLGILHRARTARVHRLGVLIIVGGPQYRVGSHRQFLCLARTLAEHGFAVFRFDLRGMGDSTGPSVSFEESGPDINAAIGKFLEVERDLDGVVLWGLCDAASSILMEGVKNEGVKGIVLLNPWVRSEASEASSRISNYYGNRLRSKVFWKKLLSGKVDIRASIRGYVSDWRNGRRFAKNIGESASDKRHHGAKSNDFRERMLGGLRAFEAPVLLVLSGADLTAGEFTELVDNHDGWRAAMEKSGVTIRRLAGADHTFSNAHWRREVEQWTIEWLGRVDDASAKQDAGPEGKMHVSL